jgi:hypothetical protein
MNHSRRAELTKLADHLNDIIEALDALKGDEESAFDNLPESFQGSESGITMTAAIE